MVGPVGRYDECVYNKEINIFVGDWILKKNVCGW